LGHEIRSEASAQSIGAMVNHTRMWNYYQCTAIDNNSPEHMDHSRKENEESCVFSQKIVQASWRSALLCDEPPYASIDGL